MDNSNANETKSTEICISIPEAGKRLGVSLSTMYKAMTNGELKTFKIGARRLVKLSDLNDYIESCR